MSQISGRTRWIPLAAAIALLLTVSLFARHALAAPAQQEIAPLDPFAQSLASALLSKDYAALAESAAPEISFVTWLGERSMVSSADALEALQSDFLDPASDPYIDVTTDLNAWFGIPPAELWRDAAVVGSVLYVRGLGADGAGEAVVGIDDGTSGGAGHSAQWTALLLAAEGFGTEDARAENSATTDALSQAMPAAEESTADESAPEAASPEPASPEALPTAIALDTSPEALAAEPMAANEAVVTEELVVTEEPLVTDMAATDSGTIELLRTVNVYPEPDPDAAPIGVLRRNQTIDLLGQSDDGDYFEILCPVATDERCWVVADPGSVQLLSPMGPPPAAAAIAPPVQQAAPVASAQAADAPERITFLQGEVAANRTGVVGPSTPRSYVLRVLAGQMLTVDLISGGDVGNFSVTGAANGQPYKQISNVARNWTFVVPVTQDYIIGIVAPVPAQYSLTVVVPPLGNQPPTPTATPLPTQPTPVASTRINFASGESSASRGGSLGAGQSIQYVIRVLRGQEMITEIFSTGSLSYSIAGADGTPIKRREVAGNPFVFTVPTTQDYRITIYADVALEYGLTVTVPPLQPVPTGTPAPAAAVRLSVPAGGTSVSVTSVVAPNGRDQYLVRAIGGQTMYVGIQSPDAIANFSVVGINDGQPLKRLENEDRAWQGILPSTQDYLITVANPRGVRVQYTLNVSFSPLQGNVPTATPQPSGPPQRIVFPAGGTSATVTGSAPQSYVLRALGGQVMSVQLYAEGDATFSVSGSDGTVLKASGIGVSSWSGDLPTNQDYIITVIPVSGSTAFTLVVTVVF